MNHGRKRKGRSDRVHLVYELIVGKKSYIGITFLRDRSEAKTVRARVLQHWYNAHSRGYTWALSDALRTLDGVEDVEYRVLARVRGKEAAHAAEYELIREHKPKLNSDIRALIK